MSPHDVEVRVSEVLTMVLGLPSPPRDPIVRSEVPAWDSLNHVEIIYAVEESLGVTFTQDELASLDGSAAIVTAAERHLAA